MSRTTAIAIWVRGRTLYIANSGDSRAVIEERRAKDLVAIDLSIDQTPIREDELECVRLCRARVLTLDQIEGLKNLDVQCWGIEEGDDGDPPRLWIQNGMYHGAAFTRSIGDSIVESIGVAATPKIVALEFTQNHLFFLLLVMGCLSLCLARLVERVVKFHDPRDTCAAIIAESYRFWLQYETRADDTIVMVVHVNGLTDTVAIQPGSFGALLRALVPQFVELTVSKSPIVAWNSRDNRTRYELSNTHVRAIENSLEKGQLWVPPSPAHKKTWEEEAHIERALHDKFLFRKFTDTQCHVLLDCMKRVEVQPGKIIVHLKTWIYPFFSKILCTLVQNCENQKPLVFLIVQGGEGDCFSIVGSGEFEVLASQELKNGEVLRVLHRYTAEKLSSFWELALM